jgi:hypothetical protein
LAQFKRYGDAVCDAGERLSQGGKDGSKEGAETQGQSSGFRHEPGRGRAQALPDRAFDGYAQRGEHAGYRQRIRIGADLPVCGEADFLTMHSLTEKEPSGRSPNGSFPQLPARGQFHRCDYRRGREGARLLR